MSKGQWYKTRDRQVIAMRVFREAWGQITRAEMVVRVMRRTNCSYQQANNAVHHVNAVYPSLYSRKILGGKL